MVDGSDAGGHRFKCPHCVLAVSSVDYDGVKGHGKIEQIGRFRQGYHVVEQDITVYRSGAVGQ